MNGAGGGCAVAEIETAAAYERESVSRASKDRDLG